MISHQLKTKYRESLWSSITFFHFLQVFCRKTKHQVQYIIITEFWRRMNPQPRKVWYTSQNTYWKNGRSCDMGWISLTQCFRKSWILRFLWTFWVCRIISLYCVQLSCTSFLKDDAEISSFKKNAHCHDHNINLMTQSGSAFPTKRERGDTLFEVTERPCMIRSTHSGRVQCNQVVTKWLVNFLER